MASNNIEFRLASKFEGEGFKKASAAIQQNQKEINSSIHGLGELSDALGAISPKAGAAASGIASFGRAFVVGGIVGGVISLALKGIAFGISKIIEAHKGAIEYTKKIGEVFDKAFIEILGDANAKVRKHTQDLHAMNAEADSMMKFLNSGVTSELNNKIYQLHMEKLQEVTDEMTAGGKAVVDAEYAMREATLKSKAALDIAANEMSASSEKVKNARELEAEAEKALAESEYRLKQVNETMSNNAEAVKKAEAEHEVAVRGLADATRAREKAERESIMSEQAFNAAQQNHILTIKEHEQKIKEANKKLDEEMIARNDLALKEEEAAAKWKEYLAGAFDREMNARNELARKEEDAALAFQEYIDNLKESAGLVNEQSVDDFLQDLEDILRGKTPSSSASASVSVSPDVNLVNPIPLPVQMPQAQPVVRGFGEHMADLRNKAREQRDLMSDLKGSYEREIEQYMLALNTEKSQRSQMQNEMISYYNDTFIPNLVSQYGPSVVEKLFEDANGKVMLKQDWEQFFSRSGGLHTMLQEFFNKLGLK